MLSATKLQISSHFNEAVIIATVDYPHNIWCGIVVVLVWVRMLKVECCWSQETRREMVWKQSLVWMFLCEMVWSEARNRKKLSLNRNLWSYQKYGIPGSVYIKPTKSEKVLNQRRKEYRTSSPMFVIHARVCHLIFCPHLQNSIYENVFFSFDFIQLFLK